MSVDKDMMLLLSEVAGDVKAVSAKIDAGQREVDQLRLRLEKQEDRTERSSTDHEQRISGLEKGRARLLGAISILAALFGVGGSYLLNHILKLPPT